MIVQPQSGAPLLELDRVHAGYNHVGVLEDITLQVPRGAIVALIGSNGAGKSTLLRVVSGILRQTSGHIRFDGKNIRGLPPDRIVSMGILQVAEGRRLFRSQSVRDNLQLGFYGEEKNKAKQAMRFDKVLELFPPLAERLDAKAGVLSGGQQQMLAIGQALMRDPALLMLDEPSLGLAPIVIDQVIEVILRLNREGTTILLVEQMIERALEIAGYAYILQSGRLIGSGTPKEISQTNLIRSAYLGMAG